MASDVSTDNISTAQIDKFTLTPTLSPSMTSPSVKEEKLPLQVFVKCAMDDHTKRNEHFNWVRKQGRIDDSIK